MNAVLYYNSAENHRVDKTDYLVEVASLDGYLREGTSVLAPTIVFELPSMTPSALIDSDDEEVIGDNDDIVIDSDYFYRFNYVYIPEFQRYYYVQDIVVTRTNIFSVSMVCDVLMSFRNDILNLNAYIDRNEFDYDILITDDKRDFISANDVEEYIPTDVPDVSLKKFDISLGGTFTHNVVMSALDFHEYPNTAWATIRDHLPKYSNPQNPYAPLSSIFVDDFSLQNTTKAYVFENADQMFKVLFTIQLAYSSRLSFIKSIMAFPFEIDCVTRPATIGGLDIDKYGLYLGDEGRDATNPIRYHQGTGSTSDIFLDLSKYLYGQEIKVAQFKLDEAVSFIDYKPYSHIEIYCPYYGWVEIDPNKVRNGEQVSVSYIVNYENGSAQMMVNRHVVSLGIIECLFSAECQLGVRIPLDITNFEENQRQKEALYLSATLSAVAGALQVGAGVATSNPMLIASGALTASSAIAKSTASANQIFDKANVQFASGVMGLYGYQDVRVRITKSIPTIPDDDLGDFAHQYGLPLKAMRSLGALSGMTIVSEVHLDNVNAFKREKDEIDRLLKTGVIL